MAMVSKMSSLTVLTGHEPRADKLKLNPDIPIKHPDHRTLTFYCNV